MPHCSNIFQYIFNIIQQSWVQIPLYIYIYWIMVKIQLRYNDIEHFINEGVSFMTHIYIYIYIIYIYIYVYIYKEAAYFDRKS